MYGNLMIPTYLNSFAVTTESKEDLRRNLEIMEHNLNKCGMIRVKKRKTIVKVTGRRKSKHALGGMPLNQWKRLNTKEVKLYQYLLFICS